MKKGGLFFLFFLLYHCGVRGNSMWTPIDNSLSKKCVTITTIESNENSYIAKIEVHGYYDNPITIEGSTFHQLSFDEPSFLSFIGEPALPFISRLIALPKGENFKVKIENEKWSEDFFVGQVIPRQQSVLESKGKPSFEKDDIIYESEEYKTERFSIGELQKWRGVNNRLLNICPIRYMPKEGKISILKEFLLDISFDDTTTISSLKSKDMGMFLNHMDTQEDERAEPQRDSVDTYDYLIVAGNIPGVLECQALTDFQKWKAFKGYKTKVVSTNMIGASRSSIKQYIANEYNKGVRYVLFIGDTNKIPIYVAYNDSVSDMMYGDYWYGCIDDGIDVEADICIGRFPTNNLSELTNMVNKTISYEKDPRSYGGDFLLVAHHENAPYQYQGCSEAIRTRQYNESAIFTTAYGAPYTLGGDSATNAFVINEINEGKNIINYRGHGTYDGWQMWNFDSSDFEASLISELSNATNDIYFCIACSNASLIEDSCFMKTFMRSNHGAVGMIASTMPSFTEVNHTFNQFLFVKLLDDHIYNIGDLNISAHIANIGTMVGSEKEKAIYNAYCYICGCDPSLEILTCNTNTFNNYTLSYDGEHITINNVCISGYKVSVVNANGTLSDVINTNNSSCSFPAPTENFYLVINKHNYVPRVIFVNTTDNYIQNKVFDDIDVDYYYIKDATISAGYNITDSIPYGNVIIESGSKLSITNRKGVRIKNSFECKLGGELQIK